MICFSLVCERERDGKFTSNQPAHSIDKEKNNIKTTCVRYHPACHNCYSKMDTCMFTVGNRGPLHGFSWAVSPIVHLIAFTWYARLNLLVQASTTVLQHTVVPWSGLDRGYSQPTDLGDGAFSHSLRTRSGSFLLFSRCRTRNQE